MIVEVEAPSQIDVDFVRKRTYSAEDSEILDLVLLLHNQ